MARNFKILAQRNGSSLHLKLAGDFDGTSAWELINVLKRSSHKVKRVFIHTGSLKHVFTFGREIFHSNLSDLRGHNLQILFAGQNASEIASEKSFCL
jgi:anti-anti-sigma regulatory factor